MGVRSKDVKRPKAELAEESRLIGERLRTAREGVKLSQRQVALVLGENQSWVSKIEKGERRADLAEGARMMRLYRVEPNTILMPEGPPRPVGKLPPGFSLAAEAVRLRGRRGKVHRPKYRGPRARPGAKAQRKPARRK